MQTKTITTTVEVIDVDSIEYPLYYKYDDNICKLLSPHKSISVRLKETNCSISVHDFTGSVVTTFVYDNISFNKAGQEISEKEFEDACIEAIAKIQSITLDN